MIAVDSSVAIAAFGEWHELNEAARAVLDAGAAIPAHALLETYSVLSAFPPPYRAAATVVDRWLDARFDRILAPPTAAQQRELVRQLAAAGRIGGAIYDALVAMTARRAGATLVTADRRAAATYATIGVDVQVLGPQLP